MAEFILSIAQLENSNGNQFHQEKEYGMAFRCYERGRRLMEEIHLANEEEEARCNKLLTKLLLNAALCANKLYWPRKACIACKEALRIKESAKAFYTFGVAKRQLGDYQAAKDLLLKAQRKEPQSVSISNELRFLEDDLMQERRRSAVVNIYLEELKEFRDDPTHDVFTLADPALIVKDLKVRLGRRKVLGCNFCCFLFRKFAKLLLLSA